MRVRQVQNVKENNGTENNHRKEDFGKKRKVRRGVSFSREREWQRGKKLSDR
jgi:hypothetical protein